jgi:hypothetical protein
LRRRFLASLRRILAAVAVTLAVLVAAFAWAIRQPNFGARSFPDGARADPAALERHVSFLASPGRFRNPGHPADLERAAGYIADAFSRTHARPSEQPYLAQGVGTRNLIARFGPDAGPRVIVGAHYDVCEDLPGADDNASGVAGLLELARLLDSRALLSPVELVAFSSEEPPYFGGADMGSAVHARSLRAAGAQVRAMISLEMIGYFAPSQDHRALLLFLVYPHRGDFIAAVGRWADRDLVREAKRCIRGASVVPPVSYSGPVAVGAGLSDHRNYWAAGYSAFMITDTAFLRNPNYHRASDTPETLDYRRLAGVVDGVLSTVVHLANDPGRPRGKE